MMVKMMPMKMMTMPRMMKTKLEMKIGQCEVEGDDEVEDEG